ncbi:MAG: hypothetical protein SFU20_05760 [Chitinophagaceae bacterium]|nr:hypothetical protein [Chitinophagaceae bacterium]
MKYQVLSRQDILKMVKEQAATLDSQIAYNKSFVYSFKNGKKAVVSLFDGEGVLFNDISKLNEMIEARYFPVKEKDCVFVTERKKILKIDENIDFFLSSLGKRIGMEINIDTSANYLDSVAKRINSVKEKELSETDNKFSLEIIIFIGEIVRKMDNSAKWSLSTIYLMNPYYIPTIKGDNGLGMKFNDIINDNLEKGNFDIRKCIERIFSYKFTRR